MTQKPKKCCIKTESILERGQKYTDGSGRSDCDYVAYLMIFAPLVCSIALVEERQSIRVSR